MLSRVLVAGRYELHEVLGRGSMGTVYSGRDVLLDRPVALKLFPSQSTDDERAARYAQEARLLARVSHPGLVTVYDVGVDAPDGDEPKPFLVMQLVHGETLAERVKGGPLPLADVCSLAAQLSSALAHIHARGIIHRDIKPANILLTPPDEPGASDSATLTDFGIARLVDGTRITSTGFTLGTANYLSPEQLSGADVCAPSDIYSLGLVLLECITGRVTYPGYGVEAALPRLHRAPAIPKQVPPDWRRLLRDMTQLRPAARPTATDVFSAVTGMVEVPPVEARTRPIPTGELARARGPAGEAAPTRLLAAPLASSHRPSLFVPARWMLIAGVIALMVLVTAVAMSAGGSGPPRAPGYPSVPGQLGTHLQQLQQDVQP